jgi:endonuclease-3
MRDNNIHHITRILSKEARQWPVPAIGHYTRTPFTTLISCILSLRTQDPTTTRASESLFQVTDTPEGLLELSPRRIERLIYPVSFYRVKARTLLKISKELLERFESRVPDELEDLLTLPGVGRKTANIVVTLAFGKPGIAVDIHVHRISNRLGYVKTRSPDETELALRGKLPPKYWIVINDLFVAFGQNLCKPTSPHCSICPVGKYCDRVGVMRSR